MPKIEPSSATRRLTAYLQGLEERLKVERARDRVRAELTAFVAKRPLLLRKDVVAVANQMKPERAAKPVKGRVSRGRVNGKPAKGKVGKAIRAARKAANLTTVQLGEKVGCSAALISLWEKGEGAPKGDKLVALSKALGRPQGAFANGHAP